MVLSHLMPVELAEKMDFAVQVTGAVVVVVVLVVQARPLQIPVVTVVLDAHHQSPVQVSPTEVAVPVVVATRVIQVTYLRLVAQAVQVLVETADHQLGMPQLPRVHRAEVEMVLRIPVAVAVVVLIATTTTREIHRVVAVMVERELLLCVMHCQVFRYLILMQLMT